MSSTSVAPIHRATMGAKIRKSGRVFTSTTL
jgi:hypothetical protein